MKPDKFNSELKKLAQGFTLRADDAVFDRIMLQRKKQRRRKIIAWISAAVLLLITAGATVYMQLVPAEKEAVSHVSGADLLPGKEPVGSRYHPAPEQKQEKYEDKVPEQKASRSSSRSEKAREQATPRSMQGVKPAGPVARPKEKYSEPQGRNQEITGDKGDSPDTGASLQPVYTSGEPVVSGEKQPVAGNQGLPDSSISVRAAQHEETDSLHLAAVPEPSPELSGSTTAPLPKDHLFSAGLYFHYLPVSDARNSASQVPLSKPDSFGLKERMRFGMAWGANFSVALNRFIGLSTGIGISSIYFDKVRTASSKLDSTTNFDVTNGAQKEMIYSRNIVEHTFTWMEVPLGLQVMRPVGQKLFVSVETGMIYQMLLKSKAYEFTTTPSGNELVYNEVENKNLERINRHIFQWYVHPNLGYRLSSSLVLSTGLTFRKSLNPYYREDYFNAGKNYLLGAGLNLRYKF